MSSPMLSPPAAHPQVRTAIVRFFLRISLIASALSLVHPANVYAVEVPLTLAEAQRRAVERSRQLTAQDFSVASARDMAIAAGQLPDPVLKVGIDNLPATGRDRGSLNNDFMTMRRVGLMQEITRSDKRRLRSDRFELEAQKSLTEKTVTTAAIERDTALAWLDRYYADAMAQVVAEQGEQAKLEIQSAEGAYRAGRGSQADVFAARSALAIFDDRASEIQRRVRNANIILARWIGDVASLSLAAKPATNTIRLDPATLNTQLEHHPQIAVLTKQVEVAEADAKLAKANEQADWTVEVAFQQRGSAYSNMVSVGVSIPLQWDRKNRQDRELSSKLALVEQAKDIREDTLRAHIAETRSMIDEWHNDRERSVRYERELIPLANQRTGATIAAYRGGKASLVDVLAARRNDIDIRIQALQLATDTDRLWAQLNFLFPTDDLMAQTGMNKDTK
ncbi:TolC family protein [Glaciimonas sp. Gout2]|uniref:TolC family protein n=1 Tax=unclassified Glaciimonas TaxID=2644401 RepID=UPI002B22830B|nr:MULTISPECIES: TolC family protein [unclassified Glaciimonas]MEB0013227.1 TolC family protein [Glaciimonas sp. Cout2]MEB0082532.1 TolC family protein [Glaciimonas sp. Gout2]